MAGALTSRRLQGERSQAFLQACLAAADPGAVPCRILAQCTDLLRTLVLPRLRLRDIQALSQTCRALRLTVSSVDSELEALALVCTEHLQCTVRQALTYTLRCLQALMPRRHLASQAGSSCQQQLHSLAGLHERIRRGQPVTACEMLVRNSEVEFETRVARELSVQSPAGNCGVVVTRGDTSSDIRAFVMGVDTRGKSWRRLPPGSSRGDMCHTGFSPCASYCAVVSQPHRRWWDTAAVKSDQVVTAHFLDTSQLCWLPTPKPVKCCRLDGNVKFSDAGAPVLAAVFARDSNERCFVVVFGPLQPEGQIFATPLARHFWWVPNTHTVLLLRYRDSVASMATLDLHSASGQAAISAWVALPGKTTQVQAVAFSAEGFHVWVAQTVHESDRQQDTSRICLSVYDVCRLDCHGSWHLEPGDDPASHLSVQVSPRILVLSFVTLVGEEQFPVFCVYKLDCTALGALLFRCTSVGQPALSADGRYIVCAGEACDLVVLDVPTGACLASMQLPGFGSAQRGIVALCWNASNPGQMHMTCVPIVPFPEEESLTLEDGIEYSTLQF